MPYYGKETSRLFREMAIIGFLAIPSGVLIQYFMPDSAITGIGISIMPAGSFLMIYGTLFYYMGRFGDTGLPESIRAISFSAMASGIVLSLVPVFIPSLWLLFELPGPIVFAFGFVLIMTRIQKKHEISMKRILSISLILDAAGLAITLVFNLFTHSVYLSLAIIPLISGVYLLFIPVTRKSFMTWQRMGYFQ